MPSELPKLETLAELIWLRARGDESAPGGVFKADKKAEGRGAFANDTLPRGRTRGRSGSECKHTTTASPKVFHQRNDRKGRESKRDGGGDEEVVTVEVRGERSKWNEGVLPNFCMEQGCALRTGWGDKRFQAFGGGMYLCE